MGDMTGLTTEDDLAGREPVVSTGRRAAFVRQADLATRLSDLASVTAALFSAVHARGVFEAETLGLLVEQAQLFADHVQELQTKDRSSVRSFSELVPLELWDRGSRRLSVQEDLASHLRGLLYSVEHNRYEPEMLQVEADKFDAMAVTFQELGRESLIAATERSTASG